MSSKRMFDGALRVRACGNAALRLSVCFPACGLDPSASTGDVSVHLFLLPFPVARSGVGSDR